MNIETEIFKRTKVNLDKLMSYGFVKNNNSYILEKRFFDNNFKAIITVNDKGIVSSKIIDLEVMEEYLNMNTNLNGEFINNVREAYKNILIDIKNNCFETNYFIYDQTNRINKYIQNKYQKEPEFLWTKYPGYAIYRQNKKWFALIGNVERNKVDKLSHSKEEIEVINLKVPSVNLDILLNEKGYYEAYHMNKSNWISIILDDTLTDDEIIKIIDISYELINKR